MAFIDEVTLHISAGRGGDGVVRWRHEKGRDMAGPGGGNAGRGGDVYAMAVRDLGVLASYKHVKEFRAQDGQNGANFGKHGSGGEDLVLKFPLGSVIFNQATRREVELLQESEKILLLSGGRGGLGNEYYKSSVNISPTEFTRGEAGEEADFAIELRLMADVGFVGLPNAGKTSLLNELTAAGAKVGDYPFTTLEPNLGVFHGLVLADIPGIIEGASEGKGLGLKFLRHISRTKMILHCVSLENEDVLGVYNQIRNELKKYDPVLVSRSELVVLTKTDLVSTDRVSEELLNFKEKGINTVAISILDENQLKAFQSKLSKFFDSLKK